MVTISGTKHAVDDWTMYLVSLKLSFHVGKDFRTVKLYEHCSKTQIFFFHRPLVSALAVVICICKPYSKSKKVKIHVNKSINSIFHGTSDVLTRILSVCLRKSDLIPQKSMRARINGKFKSTDHSFISYDKNTLVWNKYTNIHSD